MTEINEESKQPRNLRESKKEDQKSRRKPPNLQDQTIFGQEFLPLTLDTPVSNCKAAVLILVCSGYFISPIPAISGEYSPIRYQGRRPLED
jgi:hypothetical protein